MGFFFKKEMDMPLSRTFVVFVTTEITGCKEAFQQKWQTSSIHGNGCLSARGWQVTQKELDKYQSYHPCSGAISNYNSAAAAELLLQQPLTFPILSRNISIVNSDSPMKIPGVYTSTRYEWANEVGSVLISSENLIMRQAFRRSFNYRPLSAPWLKVREAS